MKKIFIAVCLLVSATVHAQQYRLPAAKFNRLQLINIPNELHVEGSDENDMLITYTSGDGKNLSSSGGDNTGIGLKMQTDGRTISLEGILSKNTAGRYVIKLPYSLMVDIQSDDFTKRIEVEKLKNDVTINTTGEVYLTDVEGGVAIRGTNADIYVTNPLLAKNKPVSIITQKGNIKLVIAGGANFDLKVGSATGTVNALYGKSKGSLTIFKGRKLETSIGKGGTSIQAQTLSGDISLTQLP